MSGLSKIGIALITASASLTAHAQSQSDYGGVGLMQMPTARMQPQGTLSLTYADNDAFRRMSVNLQVFPWLEATARYTDIRYEKYSLDPNFSSQSLKDKGVDVKLRLLQETQWRPEVALGWRDMGGTGLFAGEYLVASKQFALGDHNNWGHLDITGGIGWGYLAQRGNINNPLCHVADRFCQRTDTTKGTGGQFEIDDWFSGQTAVFVGMDYQTPHAPLSLQLEYDGNDYKNERFEYPIDPTLTEPPVKADSPWNWGAKYAVNKNLTLGLSYQRGNTLMFNVSVKADLSYNPMPQQSPKPRAYHAPDNNHQQATGTHKANELSVLSERLQNEVGVELNAVQQNQHRLTLFHNDHSDFRSHQARIERSTRILANIAPNDIKSYEWVSVNHGMAVRTDTVNADEFKATLLGERFNQPLNRTVKSHSSSDATQQGEWLWRKQQAYPSWDVDVAPRLKQSIGSAEKLYFYQLSVNPALTFNLTPRWQFKSEWGINIVNNYDEFNYFVDAYESDLPRVRTEVRKYYDEQDIWMERLYSRYTAKLTQNWYGAAYAGYLERMFAGVGVSVLNRDFASDFAWGVDINRVQQRSPDSTLGLADYRVWTGHITGYYQPSRFPNELFKLAVGRFLAGDEGAQLSYEHKFDSGTIVGAYAAVTNVSSQEYGEGSFTKGVYISIPFDLFSVKPSQSRAALGWQPITRDGGQMLGRPVSLYGMTDSRNPFYNEQ